MKISLRQIKTKQDITVLIPLVETIWREVFPPVIGEEQTEYMLRNYQSPENIRREIDNGAQYYFVLENDYPIGYFAYELQEDCLFISKIYLLQSERGKGIASWLFNWLENQALEHNRTLLRLRVNRGNSEAVNVYLHKGFIIIKTAVSDIGGGFVMDDYYLEKSI